jgi:citrate synthase
LLLTGEIPTQAQAQHVSEDLRARAKVPAWVDKLLLSLPKEMHPMTQFNIGILMFVKPYVI